MNEPSAPDQIPASYRTAPHAVALAGVVQHYDWGGYDYLPALLGTDNAAHEPCAELWLGAHPKAPSTADINGTPVPLDRLIAAAPAAILGSETESRFARRLPYLFKVLDARQMLSIQAHPTKSQAEEGYARENDAGIPLSASHRNYKDDNHKPEVHVALTDFWMLHGFRPLEEISRTLETVPELSPLMPAFGERLARAGRDTEARRALLRELYETVMKMPQAQVDSLLAPLVARLEREAPADKNSPDFWALRAARTFPLPDGHLDRGLFSVYLLNLVTLKPGQATYQPAGTLHAYLEGVNVELMANSDNVLRGGLTPKHVDVDELLSVLTFESGEPTVIERKPIGNGETLYPTPAAEFALSRIEIAPGAPYRREPGHGPDILIVLEGSVTVKSAGVRIALGRGQSCLVPDCAGYGIDADEPSVVYRASVPV